MFSYIDSLYKLCYNNDTQCSRCTRSQKEVFPVETQNLLALAPSATYSFVFDTGQEVYYHHLVEMVKSAHSVDPWISRYPVISISGYPDRALSREHESEFYPCSALFIDNVDIHCTPQHRGIPQRTVASLRTHPLYLIHENQIYAYVGYARGLFQNLTVCKLFFPGTISVQTDVRFTSNGPLVVH